MLPSNRKPTGLLVKDKFDAQAGPAQIIKRIIALIDELVSVMKKEPALVEKRLVKEHAELLKRKQRLAIDYRASVRSLAMQPDFLKQLPEDLREAARAAAKRLADASDGNAKVLRAAITALQRLIQTIIAIVKDEVLPKGGYVSTGSAHTINSIYSPTCKPVAVSRTA
jgi:hypothetical protein